MTTNPKSEDFWLLSPTIRMIITVFLIGVAWATMSGAVSQNTTRSVENEKAITSVQAQLTDMARDIRTVRNIECTKALQDSFCKDPQ